MNTAGLALLKSFEGCRLKSYRCPAGVWTCGWGATRGITPNTRWTQQEADARLMADLKPYEDAVHKYCPNTTDNEAAALGSLCYNIGPGNFAKSSVVRYHNQGNKTAAANAFRAWSKGGGRVLPGLVRRREAERKLYLA